MKEKKLFIYGDTKNLFKIRRSVRKFSKNNGFNDEESYNIEFAVDEAVTNIIKHSYDIDPDLPKKDKLIEIILRIIQNGLEIVIIDGGKSFDPGSVPEVDLKEHFELGINHGLGIFAMKRFMDVLEHSYKDGKGNITVMKKYKTTK